MSKIRNSLQFIKDIWKKALNSDQNTRLGYRTIFGIMGLFVLVFIVLVGALCKYQFVESSYWRGLATSQQLRDTELPARRGTIYDANHEILVKSTTAWVVTIDANKWDESRHDAIVSVLCEALGHTPEYIEDRLNTAQNNTSHRAKLRNKADKDAYDKLNNFLELNQINCLQFANDTRRTYTHGSLASTVLGYTGTDNDGLYGLEIGYNSTLKGTSGRIVGATNAVGGDLSENYNIIVDPKEGKSLVLTIDATIQTCIEKYLDQAVRENDVRNRACAIMMNVKTGAVYGMATMPDFDPMDYTAIKDERIVEYLDTLVGDEKKEQTAAAYQAQWRNKCISDMYEPGSVFKPITMAAALEEGVTSTNDTFNCPGYKMIGKQRVNCHKSSGHGRESLQKGMMNSCNPVFMTLGERLGGTGFFKYFKAFGFTEKTGIDLPSEAQTVAGVSYHTEDGLNKHPRDLAVSSFGQTNVVSPIQMITAIAAICNGGYLVEPYVVGEVLDETGHIISAHETVIKRQVISAETSGIVCSMLEATVSGGTAKNGYIPGYRIGGKTGTSEKIAETAETGEKTYIASFCAIAPSDDPEIALLVLLDDPRGHSHMGGTIAAPVARSILSETLPYLGIETIYTTDDVKNLDTITPTVRGKSVKEAKALISEKGLKVKVEGSGEKVTAQIPQGGQSIPRNGTVVLTTAESGRVSTVIVPDVKDMTPGAANREIINAGLNIKLGGSGYDSTQGTAVSQSIPAGTEVERGTVVTVHFIVSGATD